MMPKDKDRFTIAEYEEYKQAPQWVLDDKNSEADYHQYWGNVIGDYQKQYRDAFKQITDQWNKAIDYIEMVPQKSFDVFMPDVAIAGERIEYALCAMLELISLLYTNFPQPVYVAPSQQQDQYASALNAFLGVELKANNFNELMFEIGIDVGIASLGCVKIYVDQDQVGPFGQPGKICIDRIDPKDVYVDPKAKRLDWDHLGFIIVEQDLDLGTARKMFKEGADRINDYFLKSTKDKDVDSQFGAHLTSPVPNPVENNASMRKKVRMREAWIKDTRLKFVADIELVDNRRFIYDEEEGKEIPNLDYDPEEDESYERPKVDEEGYVVGSWVSAYPYGRCIVLAGDDEVVQDFANPYLHKRAPFAFCKGRPTIGLITTGDLTRIIKIDRKLNDILERIHRMAQNEIERPMVAETNTFPSPRSWMRMSGQASAVLVKNPGREFMRLPPTEIPQFVWEYLAVLNQAMEKMTAIAGIMKGQLAEGAQLSAEAVSSLQGMATSILKMKAELIASFMKDVGYQALWLIRDTYPEKIQIQVTQPDGTQTMVDWNDGNAASDYIVNIDSGSGLPGAEQAQSSQGLQLWRDKLIDRPAALSMMRVPGWEQMAQRIKQDELDKIESQATGRAVGLRIKKFEQDHGSKEGATGKA